MEAQTTLGILKTIRTTMKTALGVRLPEFVAVGVAGGAALAIAFSMSSSGAGREPASTRATQTEGNRADEWFIADAHAITASRLLASGTRLWTDAASSPTSLPRLREGGVDVATVVVYDTGAEARWNAAVTALRRIAAEATANGLRVLRDPREIKSGDWVAESPVRPGVSLAVEGAGVVEGDLSRFAELRRLGVSWVSLASSRSSAFVPSAYEDAAGHLSPSGRDAVAAMNRAGILIDVVHAPDPAILEIVALSTAPVIASHAASRSRAGIVENLTDDAIRAIARKGGVIFVNLGSPYLTKRFADRARAVTEVVFQRHGGDWSRFYPTWAEMDAKAGGPIPPATFEEALDAIDHLIRLAGPDHAGLGSDLDGVANLPLDLKTAAAYPTLASGLLRRGYTERNVRAFLGGNWLRAWRSALDQLTSVQS
jgi:membrane dipeptidase